MKAYNFRFCVMPLDDFDPPPNEDDREETFEIMIRRFRMEAKRLERNGQFIVGFNCELREEKE